MRTRLVLATPFDPLKEGGEENEINVGERVLMKEVRELEEALKGADLALLQAESAIRELVKVKETMHGQIESLVAENEALRSTMSAHFTSTQQLTSAELKLTKKLIDSIQMDRQVKLLRGELKQEQQHSLGLNREITLLRGEVARLERRDGIGMRY